MACSSSIVLWSDRARVIRTNLVATRVGVIAAGGPVGIGRRSTYRRRTQRGPTYRSSCIRSATIPGTARDVRMVTDLTVAHSARSRRGNSEAAGVEAAEAEAVDEEGC